MLIMSNYVELMKINSSKNLVYLFEINEQTPHLFMIKKKIEYYSIYSNHSSRKLIRG
jgi:hypothetical protein